MGELNQYLIESLNDESQWNEELALMNDLNFSENAIEMQAAYMT